MEFYLEEKEYSGDQDFTEVDTIRFSKSLTGMDKAAFISKVFSDIYMKDTPTKAKAYRTKVVSDFYFTLSEKTLSFRGYKKSLTAIIADYAVSFGSTSRKAALETNNIFSEDSNVFPFRAMLERVREHDRNHKNLLHERELKKVESEIKLLQLKGLVIDDIGVSERHVVNYGNDGIKICIGESWYGITIYPTPDGNFTISLNQTVTIDEEDLKTFLLPVAKVLGYSTL